MLKAAIVGFGRIGRRHATIIHHYPGTQLLAVSDTDPSTADHTLIKQGVPFYNSIEDLLREEQPDVVHICTPNGLHTTQAIYALQRNCNVVIEKPMGLTRESCEDVIHTALEYNRSVFVVKQNRYSPPSIWLKKMVDEGLLGRINLVQINCYWNRDHRYYQQSGKEDGQWKGSKALDGGTLFTQFSHFVDVLFWIFGDIKEPKAHFMDLNHQTSTEFEDSGVINFQLARGGIGSFNFSTAVWDRNMESSITVLGSNGSIRVGGQYMDQVEYCHVKGYEFKGLEPTNPPNDYGPYQGSAANHHYVIENMVNVLQGQGRISANALEGLKVVEIIEKMYASASRPHKDLNF